MAANRHQRRREAAVAKRRHAPPRLAMARADYWASGEFVANLLVAVFGVGASLTWYVRGGLFVLAVVLSGDLLRRQPWPHYLRILMMLFALAGFSATMLPETIKEFQATHPMMAWATPAVSPVAPLTAAQEPTGNPPARGMINGPKGGTLHMQDLSFDTNGLSPIGINADGAKEVVIKCVGVKNAATGLSAKQVDKLDVEHSEFDSANSQMPSTHALTDACEPTNHPAERRPAPKQPRQPGKT